MGCAFSTTAAPGPLRRPYAGVRVIHTNGYVEDFEGPGVVTVAHVTGCLGVSPGSSSPAPAHAASASASASSPPRYVLCSAAHLLQPGRGPFRPDDALQPGTVYFLLPQTVFQAESSAVDLACLMNRLTALARKGCATSAPKPSPLDALLAASSAGAAGGSHDNPKPQAAKEKEPCGAKGGCGGRPAPWRPRLDRIDESMRSASSLSTCSEA